MLHRARPVTAPTDAAIWVVAGGNLASEQGRFRFSRGFPFHISLPSLNPLSARMRVDIWVKRTMILTDIFYIDLLGICRAG